MSTITTFPYVEDFESGKGSWFHGPMSANTSRCTGANFTVNDTWAFGTPNKNIAGFNRLNTAHSGDSAWVLGGLSGSYSPNERSFVASPCFNFSTLINPAMSMWVWWETEYDPTAIPTLFTDGVNIQYSTDNGQTWSVLDRQNYGTPARPSFTFNWYVANDIDSKPGYLCIPATPTPGWSGNNGGGSGSWVRVQHQLAFLAGTANVRFRVSFANKLSGTAPGFAFDDVSIGEMPEVDLGPDVTLCAGESAMLDAGCDPVTFGNRPGWTYLWETGPVPFQGDSCRWEIFTANTVVVQVTNAAGLIDRDTIEIAFSPTADPGLTPIIFCPEDTFTISSRNNNPNIFSLWKRYNDTTMTWDTIGIMPAIQDYREGRYAVCITDIWGCEVFDTVTTTQDTVPQVILPVDDTVCIGTPYTLIMQDHVPGTNYTWEQDRS
ncbi:MAG: hypothetical protein AB8F95_16110, partial [Bacteroidia bacterium]